jgi:hypothetical protein
MRSPHVNFISFTFNLNSIELSSRHRLTCSNAQVSMQQSLNHPSVVRIFGVISSGLQGANSMEFTDSNNQKFLVHFPAIVMGVYSSFAFCQHLRCSLLSELCSTHDLKTCFEDPKLPPFSWLWRVQTTKKIAQGKPLYMLLCKFCWMGNNKRFDLSGSVPFHHDRQVSPICTAKASCMPTSNLKTYCSISPARFKSRISVGCDHAPFFSSFNPTPSPFLWKVRLCELSKAIVAGTHNFTPPPKYMKTGQLTPNLMCMRLRW